MRRARALRGTNVNTKKSDVSKLMMRATLSVAAMLMVLSLSAQGRLVAWGDSANSVITGVPVGNNFVKVSAGWRHAVAVRQDGTIVSWGWDGYGQVSATPPGTFSAVAAGYTHSVAIRTDGSLESWGSNLYNQVSSTPSGNDYVAVAAATDYSIAIRSDGTMVAWGFNGYFQVTGVPSGNNFVDVAVGAGHTIALRSNGEIETWGYNAQGQVSPLPSGSNFVAVAAGGYHSVALRSDGTLVTWGNDIFGEVIYTPTNSTYYRHGIGWVSMAPSGYVGISAGYFHSLAKRADGSLVSWGRNDVNQVNNTPAGNNFTAVSCGAMFSIAIERVDTDNDGLSDAEETDIHGTNPNDSDTDDDGLMDGTEVEMAQGSGCPNPLDSDSDDDGLSDGVEVGIGTSTCNPDTDDDGVSDGTDPTPTVPGVPGSWIEERLRILAADLLQLNLAAFDAPNANAAKGRRNAMSNRVTSAANLYALGDVQGAMEELQSLMEKLDGSASPADWLLDPEKEALYAYIELLIILM